MLRISKKSDYAIFLLTRLAGPVRGDTQRGISDPGDRVSGERVSGERAADESSPLQSATELARSSGLNRSLVANLLKEYVRAGLLDSVRGQRGGYRLARHPESITLRQILQVTEGPISLVECAAHTTPRLLRSADDEAAADDENDLAPGSHGPSCDLAGQCASRAPLLVVHRRMLALFDSVTLAELARPVRSTPLTELTPVTVPSYPHRSFPACGGDAAEPATPAPKLRGKLRGSR